MIHVLLSEPGGMVRTVPTDFVTASRLVRAARLRGIEAAISPWTKWETRHWKELLGGPGKPPQALTIAVAVEEGTCQCTLRTTGESILCLVPFGVEVKMPDGNAITFPQEWPSVPQGTADGEHPSFAPPNLPHGQATEERDG